MNLTAYKLSEIQSFMSLLNQFESEGISDVRFVRAKLQTRIDNHIKSMSKTKRSTTIAIKAAPKCPDCESPMVQAKNNEGLKILACRVCRYSEVQK